mgnify:CR=1 FL=1|tara:strand:+ start:7087 stop:7509 length:423 start_codon:yes stop_codon:yes gene_type:complete
MDKKIKKKNTSQKLTEKEIVQKLKEYTRIDDITKVAIGTHLRYFIVDDKGNNLFRLGGFLNKIVINDGYIVLGNNKITWSVQLKKAIIFKKMDYHELKKKIERKVRVKYLKKIQKLEEDNNNLRKSLKEIRKKKLNKKSI